MKISLRLRRAIVFAGIAAIGGFFALRIYQFTTRPDAIGWTEDALRERITKGDSRADVLSVIGKPHSKDDDDQWFYWNSYKDVSISRSNMPKTFSIFFEDNTVSGVLSGPH